MTTALSVTHAAAYALWSSLRQGWRWAAPFLGLVLRRAWRTAQPGALASIRPAAALPPCPLRPVPALRVVRLVDADLSRNQVGRMVISGRMADVCAELKRLAAREATRA